MIKLISILLSCAFILLLSTPKLNAEITFAGTVMGGYHNNLFGDSSSVSDQYSAIEAEARYYLAASTQISAKTRYSAFRSINDLSNLNSLLSVTFIPTSENSSFSLLLSGDLSFRRFGPTFKLYNQTKISAGLGINYRLLSQVHLQSSLYYLDNNYQNSDFGSNHGFNFASGVYFTVLGSNSLALKINYLRRFFTQPSLIQNELGDYLIDLKGDSEAFDIIGLLIRYSRPLGERTGLNFSFAQRHLRVDNNFIVKGYTVDYLSPWSDLWEGTSFSGGLKHIFAKQVTVDFSLAYYDKSFLDVIEYSETSGETYMQAVRDEQLTSISIAISKSVSLDNNKLLVPSARIDYKINNSTLEYFDFNDLQISVALRFVL